MRTHVVTRLTLVAAVVLVSSACADMRGAPSDAESGWTLALPRMPGTNLDGEGAYSGRGWPGRVVVRPEEEPPVGGGDPEAWDADDDGDLCRNGADDDLDGLVDCEELACLGEPACCVDVTGSWVAAPESW